MHYEAGDFHTDITDVHRQLCIARTSDDQSRFFYRQGLLRDVGYGKARLRNRGDKRHVGRAILRRTRGALKLVEDLHGKDVRRTNGFDSLQLHQQRLNSIKHESQRCNVQCVERRLRQNETVASRTRQVSKRMVVHVSLCGLLFSGVTRSRRITRTRTNRLCTKSQIPPALAAWSFKFALE